jgi:beta-glucosidase
MYLPGQMGGDSTYDLLFGNVSPSGRLAETWPENIDDIPFIYEFTKTDNDLYKEGLFVGYRYYNSFDKKVMYPFGYGLSYSTFSYDDMKAYINNNQIVVKVNVTNTGDMVAKEVVEVFVKAPKTKIIKPHHELRGFTKVSLNPGETKEATIVIDINDIKYYINNEWVLESGVYTIQICKNANEVLLSKDLEIKSKDIIIPNELEYTLYTDYYKFINMTDEEFSRVSKKEFVNIVHKKPYNLNTPLNQYKSFWGRKIYKLMLGVCNHVYKKALRSKGPNT